MIFLVLSIICSTCILLVFKYVSLHKIPVLPVIVINYTICVVCGWVMQIPLTAFIVSDFESWIPIAICMGILFISVFYLMSISVRYSGVTITSVANKLSLIIPVITAIYLYGESLNIFKIIGIILAVSSIVLIVRHEEKTDSKTLPFLHFILPVLVFIGSGLVDTLANYAEKILVPQVHYNYFLVAVFGTAAIIGWAILIPGIIKVKHIISTRICIIGIALGIPNYYSMYFLIMGLNTSGLDSSVFFPINNIAIIILSFISAVMIFREHYSKRNVIGICAAIISIFLMIWA